MYLNVRLNVRFQVGGRMAKRLTIQIATLELREPVQNAL
jgi:hypothetical protein